MAYIQEKIKGKKIVSFKFKACVGREADGKQVFRCTTWYPPDELTPTKARKEAQKVAVLWEDEARQAYLKEQEDNAVAGFSPSRPYTFDGFVNEVWLPLCVRDGSHRPSTVAMYTHILKVILPQFEGVTLSDISGVHISQYLRWLRNDYRKPDGKPLAEKSIKHHYNILGLIFAYAEKQDIIDKNPMKKVDPPKVTKKDVDALTEDEAVRFFNALLACDFEFRCVLQVLLTTGLRRGECLGLQWADIDFQNGTLTVNRSTTYTPECGITVAAPKTAHSVRTIPVVPSTLTKTVRPSISQCLDGPFFYEIHHFDIQILFPLTISTHECTIKTKAVIDMKEAWKKHFAPVIWQRGQKCYEDGAVTNLRQDGNTIPSLYKPEGKAFEK